MSENAVMNIPEGDTASSVAGQAPQAGKNKLSKAYDLFARTMSGTHPKIAFVHLLLWPLPTFLGLPLRNWAYRFIGFQVEENVSIMGNVRFNGNGDLYSRLTVGRGSLIDAPVYLDLNAPVTIGRNVAVSRHTIILTDTHEIGPEEARMGRMVSFPVTIEDGAWICAGCIIYPGVTIGKGAIISAGAVVTRDVPPNTMVAGAPARVSQHL